MATSSSTPELKVDANQLFPLEITNIRYELVAGGVKNLTYDLRNNGNNAIVSAELFVEVSDGVNVSRNPQYFDAWASDDQSNGKIQPNMTVPGPSAISIESKSAVVKSTAISVGAIELADGTWIGADATDFHKYVSSKRKLVIAHCRRIQKAIESGGGDAAKEIFQTQAGTTEEWVAKTLLNRAWEKDGTLGLRSEITRMTHLVP